MAGAQFEYDKSGGTSYYFITTFFALALTPLTYYFWPRKKKNVDEIINKCHCKGCRAKFFCINAIKPKDEIKNTLIKIGLVTVWLIFIYLAYHAAKIERDYNEYDPYSILELDRGASVGEIKKKYRQLSALYHPDVKETGDSARFMKIAKAYAALTDEDSRKNWEEYGNPDGPGATQFGIALPAWIVEKGNSIWVLSAYILVFMIILPTIVGTWWYKSIKYSGDKVLIDTSQMYMYFFHKTPNMILRRVIMILAASFEFCKFYNTEIQERPSDNVELPQLLKTLTNLNEKNKEKPLSAPYSVKARILLHAHLSRLELPPNTLELDKEYILKKCPTLLNEMVTCVAQLMAFANSGRIQHSPRLETMENIMKTSQMLIQALWEYKSPLLQLPHIGEDILKHCINKKYMVRNIRDLACMKESDRKALLSKLTDREYADINFILSKMPIVSMDIVIKVIDDEDPSTITANSIVTVTVMLYRKDYGSVMENCNTNRMKLQSSAIESMEDKEQQLKLTAGNSNSGQLGNGDCRVHTEGDGASNTVNASLYGDYQADEDQQANEEETENAPKKQPTYKPKKKNFSKNAVAKLKAQQKKKNQQKPTATQKTENKPENDENETIPAEDQENDAKIDSKNEKPLRSDSVSSSSSVKPLKAKSKEFGPTQNEYSDQNSSSVPNTSSPKERSNKKTNSLNDELTLRAKEKLDEFSGADENSTPSSSDTDLYSSQDERTGSSSKRKTELKEVLALAALENADAGGCDSCDEYAGPGAGLKHQIAPLAKPKTLPKGSGSKVIIRESTIKSTSIPQPESSKETHKNPSRSTDKDTKSSKEDEKSKIILSKGDNNIENDSINNNNPENNNDDDDELWDEDFQKTLRKHEKIMFEGGKKKDTHEVHCPFFPETKYERWWLYMADRKHSTLITAPIYVTSLNDSEEFQLKFPAPPKPGVYAFTVVLRSDSYLDCDFTKLIKLDVKEEKAMDENHPQWDISESENEDGNNDDKATTDGGIFGTFNAFLSPPSSKKKRSDSTSASSAQSGSGSDSESENESGKENSNGKKKDNSHDTNAKKRIGKKTVASKPEKKTAKKNLSDMEYTTEESSSD